MASVEESTMQTRRLPFTLADAVCSITEHPQKQIYNRNFTSVTNDDVSSSDSWCDVAVVKKEDVDEEGYKCIQTENIHLFLSDMLISSVEQLHWNDLRKHFDFCNPVDPSLLFSTLTNSCPSADEPCLSTRLSGPFHSEQREGNSVFYASSSQDSAVKSAPEDRKISEQSNVGEVANTKSNVVNALFNYMKGKRRNSIGGADNTDLDSVASCANAPQNLVSITNEITIHRYASDEFLTADGKRIRLRGSSLWLPPKKKFIYDIPSVNYKDFAAILASQSFRCAGCSKKFDDYYAKRSRICHYYSKLFCQCCHQGEKSKIPAQILHNWNFKEYPVCDLAFKFLRDNEDQPIFNVQAINPMLYKKTRALRKVRDLRVQVSHMWQYVQLCPMAEQCLTSNGYRDFSVKTMFTSLPRRLLSLDNVDTFSMLDFESVANKNLLEVLEPIVQFGAIHIENCLHCQQRAFLCQVCLNPKHVLFPFQLDAAYRCDGCGALSHMKCHLKKTKEDDDYRCTKCERIQKKRIRQLQRSTSSASDKCDSE